MTKHSSSLSTFLFFSIAIILTGIMLVIVAPVENSPGIFTTTDNFEEEQSNLIQHVYQLREKQVTGSRALSHSQQTAASDTLPMASNRLPEPSINDSVPAQQALPIPKPEAPPAYNDSVRQYNRQNEQYQPRYMPVPQFDNAYDVWNTTSENSLEPLYSLKNNPWSPDYKPGY